MRKILFITIIALLPSFAAATTVTASVAGTLKVYQTLSVTTQQSMIFPAQFAGATAANLITVHGGAPATGIPNVVGDTQGRAGLVTVTGTGGTIFTPSIPSPIITMTNSGNNISAGLQLFADTGFTASPPTVIPGTGNSQVANLYVRGFIDSGTTLVAGTYTGSGTVQVVYN